MYLHSKIKSHIFSLKLITLCIFLESLRVHDHTHGLHSEIMLNSMFLFKVDPERGIKRCILIMSNNFKRVPAHLNPASHLIFSAFKLIALHINAGMSVGIGISDMRRHDIIFEQLANILALLWFQDDQRYLKPVNA